MCTHACTDSCKTFPKSVWKYTWTCIHTLQTYIVWQWYVSFTDPEVSSKMWWEDFKKWVDPQWPFICGPVHPHSRLPFVWGYSCHKFLPCMSETPVSLCSPAPALQTQPNSPLTLEGLKLTSGPQRQRWNKGLHWYMLVNVVHFSASTHHGVCSSRNRFGNWLRMLSEWYQLSQQAIKDHMYHLTFPFVAAQVFIVGLGCHINIYWTCLHMYYYLWPTCFQQLFLFFFFYFSALTHLVSLPSHFTLIPLFLFSQSLLQFLNPLI